jgi:hypothetical protein
VTAGGKEKWHSVRISDREAPFGALRQRGLELTPRQPICREKRVRAALGFAGKVSEGLSDACDALAHRHAGKAEQVGDLAAAHAEIDQQSDHAT